MNSIESHIDGGDAFGELFLERSTHKGSFLLVEGNSDKSLFDKFVSNRDCSIIICHGKEKVIDAINISTNHNCEGVIAILDKDYSRQLKPPNQREILYTDQNDTEIMILCSDALDAVLLEYGIAEKRDELEKREGKPVRDIIFDASGFLGALRLISQKRKWNLKFQGMKYRFYARNSFKIKELESVQHITGRSDVRPQVPEKGIVELAIKERKNHAHSRDICCGHDCVRVLGRALNCDLGNTKSFDSESGAKSLERVLRVSYNWDHFHQTSLYKEIKTWEAESGYKVLQSPSDSD